MLLPYSYTAIRLEVISFPIANMGKKVYPRPGDCSHWSQGFTQLVWPLPSCYFPLYHAASHQRITWCEWYQNELEQRLTAVSVSSFLICQEPSRLWKALLSLGKQTGKVIFHPKGILPYLLSLSNVNVHYSKNKPGVCELRKNSWNWFIPGLPNSIICTR